jgi:hypothetical protein
MPSSNMQFQLLRFHPDEFAVCAGRQDQRYDVAPHAFGDNGNFLAFPGEKHGLVVGLQPVRNEFQQRAWSRGVALRASKKECFALHHEAGGTFAHIAVEVAHMEAFFRRGPVYNLGR